MPVTFKFINKDSTSESLSHNSTSGVSYAEINRHAQKFSRQECERLKERVIPSRAVALVGWHRTTVREEQEADEGRLCRKRCDQFAEDNAKQGHRRSYATTRALVHPSTILQKGKHVRTGHAYKQDTSSKRTLPSFFTRQPPLKLVPCINHGDDGSSEPSAATNNPLFNERLHEPLDPFLRLAGAVSFHERILLHHYLVEGPARFYGIRSGALYCPVRDMTVPMVQTNDMWLQWTLLSAEMSILGPVRASKSVSFLARRARTYRSMNQSISDPETRFSDHIITGLTMAGLIESRLDNALSARMHMAAVRALVRSRSVAQGIIKQVNYATFCNCTRVGLGTFAFTDLTEFSSAVENLLSVMVGMQRWSLSQYYLLNTQVGYQDSRVSQSLRRYNLARFRTFSPSALLHRFIGPISNEQDDFDKRSHVAHLWGINRILYELRDDLDQCSAFLETLNRYVESANEPSLTDRRTSDTNPELSELKVTAVSSILGYVGTLYLPKWVGGLLWGNSSFWWQTVDAVELLHLLPSPFRERVLKELSSRLTEFEMPGVVKFMSEHELRGVAAEMRQAWLAEQAVI